MSLTMWRIGRSRELTAELDGLRAVVSCTCEDGTARFMVLKPFKAGRHLALVHSGHRPTVRQAMAAAEQTSERLTALR